MNLWLRGNLPPYWKKPLSSLLPKNGRNICLKYKSTKGCVTQDINLSPDGAFSALFYYHSCYKNLSEIPWPVFLISAAFGGCDGIDSDFFKSQLGLGNIGMSQTEVPPKVATPFGREFPALGGNHKDAARFAGENKRQFDEILGKLSTISATTSADRIPILWQEVRKALKEPLRQALGYTNKPTHDVTLWDHVHGVAAMGKALAAALALDSAAAALKKKKVIFPLRSPEINLPEALFNDDQWFKPSNPTTFTELQQQVQTRFKVLSVLIRDSEQLEVGRKVGDILGYHLRRDELFDTLAAIIEKDLALGTEIFRDHAGIHLILPWCQDSASLTRKDSDTQAVLEERKDSDTQAVLEEMVHEIVDVLFANLTTPQWLPFEAKEKINAIEEARKAKDFEVVAQIGLAREKLVTMLENPKDQAKIGHEFPNTMENGSKTYEAKAQTQGLLFLKECTRIDAETDKKNPHLWPPDPVDNSKGMKQLCPICKRRPVSVQAQNINENDRPCQTCNHRRQKRANLWWQNLTQSSANTTASTIWTAEAADSNHRANLLTLAFDLSSWFNGTAFDGFFTPELDIERYHPIYPAPARIRGVWEGTQAFLQDCLDCLSVFDDFLSVKKRPCFEVDWPPKADQSHIKSAKKGVLLSGPAHNPALGDWFLGQAGDKWFLLGVSGQNEELKLEEIYKDLQQLELQQDKESNLILTEATFTETDDNRFSRYRPLVEILTNSPTRFQIIAPAKHTLALMERVTKRFLDHFGAVAHLIEFCAVCVAFREKFPFYLVLAAADRLVKQELSRARKKPRACRMDAEGLSVALDPGEPDHQFLPEGYHWKCLQPEQRDPYRSLLTETIFVPEEKINGIYWGWQDKKKLFSLERKRVAPSMKVEGGIPRANPEEPAFSKPSFSNEATLEKEFHISVPRFAWNYIYAAGDRHGQQLSIPLLALADWRHAYETIIQGVSWDCDGCKKEWEAAGTAPLPPIRGLADNKSQQQNLLDEILSSHEDWQTHSSDKDFPDFFKKHLRAICGHPNTCGRGWGYWSQLNDKRNGQTVYPLAATNMGATGIKMCLKCEVKALKLLDAIRGFEHMAFTQNGRPLLITQVLLNRVCDQRKNHQTP